MFLPGIIGRGDGTTPAARKIGGSWRSRAHTSWHNISSATSGAATPPVAPHASGVSPTALQSKSFCFFFQKEGLPTFF
jgi:hypothetical protein